MLGGSSHLVNGFITPIISGLTLLIPLITGVISGMSHQVGPFHLCVFSPKKRGWYWNNMPTRQLRPCAITTTFWGLAIFRRRLGQVVNPPELHGQEWNPQTWQACLRHLQGPEGEVWLKCPCDQGEEVWVAGQAGCRGHQPCVVDCASWTSQWQGA